MMKEEIIQKARSAKSAGELIELAKANGREITEEQAENLFKGLSQGGEMSDDELESAVGGCGGIKMPSWESDLGFSSIDCKKGQFLGAHTQAAAKSYWRCNICGGHILSDGPLSAYTRCKHVKQFKVLTCSNCANYNWTNGQCEFEDDGI